MAINQIGRETKLKAGITTEITIAGVTLFSGVSTTAGYRTITEIIGHDGQTAVVVMAGQDNLDVTVNGYVDVNGTAPKNGDSITMTGYDIAWIDGITIAETPEGVTTFTGTVHGRKTTIQA